MNGRSGTFSPVSADGSEWSGISRYQNTDSSSFSPLLSSHRGNLATPPISGSSNGIHGPMSNGTTRRPNDSNANPSPPNSIGRSSYGTSISDGQRRKTFMMEESLAQHYAILKMYLAQSLRDEKGNPKPNKARDKLLRLSPVQFQELSTDVFDELLRRQNAGGPQTNGPAQVPIYLLPRDNFHPKRNQARQKLATLPPPRFRDLATDVFYELERRFPRFAAGDIDRNGSPALSAMGPPSRQGTPNGMRPSSRGQGPTRQPPGPGGGFAPRKASLGAPAYSGLAVSGAAAQDAYERPTAKTFQSNTIVPNKSTLVEDDDDQTGPEDNEYRRSDAFANRREPNNSFRSVGGNGNLKSTAQPESRVGELQEKVNELENIVREKDSALAQLHGTHQDREKVSTGEREQWTDLRSELERRLRDAVSLNNNLHSELEKVRANHADTERQLQSHKDQSTRQQGAGENDWKKRFENLDRAHQTLQVELRQQQTVTNEVKQEAAVFLEEMKALSTRSGQSCEREEKLVFQVHRLEDQVKEWKNRYARTKTQLRNLRASSLGLSLQQPDTAQLGRFTEPDGLIKELHVTRFQIAIDELLRTARGSEPDSVLAHVKSVVIAVRNISQDVGHPSKDEEQAQQTSKLKARISATANNLITASKNFAISNGLSPVSLLDAAASHLTAAVVNLLRTVKIQPTPPVELEDDDDSSFIAESPAYYGIPFDRSSAGGESVYSAVSSPQPPSSKANSQGKPIYHAPKVSPRAIPPNSSPHDSTQKAGLGLQAQDRGIEDLKTSVLDQKELLLQTIQSLVGSVRAHDNAPAIKDYTHDIASIVSKVVGLTQHATHDTNHSALRDRLDPIIESLTTSRSKLLNASVEGENVADMAAWKEFAQTLPPLTFPIAKQMTELLLRLGHVEGGHGRDESR